MPRPTFFNSPKFALAQRRLKEPDAHLLGHLEFMWAAANECGEPVFRSAEQVEAAARWDGEEGVFAATLSKDGSNFLDAKDNGTYEVHDFWHHCPDYVRKRRAREKERQSSPNNDGQRPVTDRSTADNGRPPAPAPSPTPSPSPSPTQKEDQEPPNGGGGGDATSKTVKKPKTPTKELDALEIRAFERFWAVYPRRDARKDAEKAWGQMSPDVSAVLATLEWQAPLFKKRDYDKIPLPGTYLRGERWKDQKPVAAYKAPEKVEGVLDGDRPIEF